jgi:hypothetical protein
MSESMNFDVGNAHTFFSQTCFNQAWDLIVKPDRTPAETDDMLQLAHASAWHWRQRPDCTKEKLSIGYWQLSRVFALAGDAQRATRYADLCLEASRSETPFLIACAYEALARAASVAGDRETVAGHLQQARTWLDMVEDQEDRELIQKDIDAIHP